MAPLMPPAKVGDAVLLGNYDGIGVVLSVNEPRGVGLVATDECTRGSMGTHIHVELGLIARSRDLLAREVGA